MTTNGDLLDDIRALRGGIEEDRAASDVRWRAIDAAFDDVAVSELRGAERAQRVAFRSVAYALSLALLLFIVIACASLIQGEWTHQINLAAGSLGVVAVANGGWGLHHLVERLLTLRTAARALRVEKVVERDQRRSDSDARRSLRRRR